MRKYSEALLKHYFKEHSLVESNIDSFNDFVDFELQKIIEENQEVEPTIIPHNIDEFKIRFDKIWIERPTITEADGSKKNIYPVEARLRKITYASYGKQIQRYDLDRDYYRRCTFGNLASDPCYEYYIESGRCEGRCFKNCNV